MDEKNELLALLDELKESNILVIVEGPKDKRALEQFQIVNVMTLSKKPLYEVVEEVSKEKECAILTDLDKKGKELFGKLNQGLQQRGVLVNNNLRNFLFKKTKLSHTEGLDTYIRNLY